MKDIITKAILDASEDKITSFNAAMEKVTMAKLKDELAKTVKQKEIEIINKYK